MKDGGPAFPKPAGSTGLCESQQYNHASHGMSLRDYFAGQALAGLLAGNLYEPELVAMWVGMAYDAADAMLKARNA